MVGHPLGGRCASTMYDVGFADFDVSWVVHEGPRSQVPCSGKDAMEVRRGHGHMQASLGQTPTIMSADPQRELINQIVQEVFCCAF